MNKGTEIVSITVTLGKLTHQGLKEAEVAKLVPGAEIELRDVYYNTSGMGMPWLTCTDFKVAKTRAPHDGVAFALGEIAGCGTSLMLGAALNSAVFRGGEAPTVETTQCFDACKALIESTKVKIIRAKEVDRDCTGRPFRAPQGGLNTDGGRT